MAKKKAASAPKLTEGEHDLLSPIQDSVGKFVGRGRMESVLAEQTALALEPHCRQGRRTPMRTVIVAALVIPRREESL
jgi:hypothetical protein